MLSCCEFHSKTECSQGDNCPVRAFYAETEGVFPCVTGCSTKALPDPAKQPLPEVDRSRDRAELTTLWLAVALVTAAAVVAGFLTK